MNSSVRLAPTPNGMIHQMPEPIDYARAESADVVRKKFRRRVVMFVVATVLLIVVAFDWRDSSRGGRWEIGNNRFDLISATSNDLWVILYGPPRTNSLPGKWTSFQSVIGSDEVGIRILQGNTTGTFKWAIKVRYRTLFLLAMIPWIITLIRLIRSRVKHVERIDR